MNPIFRNDFYAGLADIELENDSNELGEGIKLIKTYVHVMRPRLMAFTKAEKGKSHPAPWKAINDGEDVDICAELYVPKDVKSKSKCRADIACDILFTFRLGVDPAITLPLFSNTSFSSIVKSRDEDSKFFEYELDRRHFPLGVTEEKIGLSATSWVKQNWKTVHKLRQENPEFSLAMDALDQGQFVKQPQLILMLIWAALEALFSPSKTEISFRVSAYIASFLEQPGPARLERQKAINDLYTRRSAAAHGKSKHSSEDLMNSFNLLREILLKMVDQGEVPTKDKLKAMLFGA